MMLVLVYVSCHVASLSRESMKAARGAASLLALMAAMPWAHTKPVSCGLPHEHASSEAPAILLNWTVRLVSPFFFLAKKAQKRKQAINSPVAVRS